jgi:hypothetical protein
VVSFRFNDSPTGSSIGKTLCKTPRPDSMNDRI